MKIKLIVDIEGQKMTPETTIESREEMEAFLIMLSNNLEQFFPKL